jgi:phosphatidylinositol glycan class O
LISIYLFTSGFFLTRYEIKQINQCELIQNISTCTQPKYNKTILLLIDALRFDFINFNETYEENENNYFVNQLPILHEILNNESEYSQIYRFQSDVPTVTMQRLKGLTTGK